MASSNDVYGNSEVRVFDLNIDSAGTATGFTYKGGGTFEGVWGDSSKVRDCHLEYIGDGKFVIAYSKASAYGAVRAFQVAADGGVTMGTEVDLPSSDQDDIAMGFCVGRPNKAGSIPMTYCVRNGASNTYNLVARGLTVSGTTVTMASSPVQINYYLEIERERDRIPQISYNKHNDNYLVVYRNNTTNAGTGGASNKHLRGRTITVSGTTVSTVGSEIQINNPSVGENPGAFSVCYDDSLKKHVAFITDNYQHFDYYRVTTPTSGNPVTTTDLEWDGMYARGHDTDYDERWNQYVVGIPSSGTGYVYTGGGRLTDPTTTTTQGAFIGFSAGTYSNGATATVNVVGNTLTTTNLSPGTQYYVGKDGELVSESWLTGISAGNALSTTKLLIK